jgi:hypothetical protein
MPAEQNVGCQQVIRRTMYEDFVIYLSFPGRGGGVAHLQCPAACPAHFGPAIASLADVICPPSGLLGILNANRKVCKRTDTDVAFTREYSKVSFFHKEREVH